MYDTAYPVIEKSTRNNNVYYTVHWSALQTGDKYQIQTGVPAMSGIYELYYKDMYGKLILHEVNYAWYGGLRSRLRKITDPELEENPEKRQFISTKKFLFRYSLSKSFKDMQDVVYFLAAAAHTRQPEVEVNSGRYKTVYLRESSPNKITDI